MAPRTKYARNSDLSTSSSQTNRDAAPLVMSIFAHEFGAVRAQCPLREILRLLDVVGGDARRLMNGTSLRRPRAVEGTRPDRSSPGRANE